EGRLLSSPLRDFSRQPVRGVRRLPRGVCGRHPGLPALCIVPVDGPGLPKTRTLVSSDEFQEIAPMDWSPDGRSIAVSLRRRDRTAQIGLVSVSDGSVRILQSVDWRGPTRIFFSPD